MSFQIYFAEQWVRFLRENFHSTVQIAVAFSVTEQTARNWLAGTSVPRGPHVARAMMEHPDFANSLSEWAA